MSSISSGIGIGSGIDIDSLVSKLITAEGSAKSTRLTTREATFQSKLSAFGSFRGALSTLQTALAPLKDIAKFQGRSVAVGDEEILSATAGATTAVGTYDVEVEQLATAHKIASGGFAADAVIGTGTLQIALGASSFNVTFDSGSTKLADIRDAINKASDNPGVTASIVNETGVGAHLVLTANKTGAANTIVVTQNGGDAGLQAFVAGLHQTQAAGDSRIVVNGFVHQSASNSVSTAVDGVTFNLLKVSEPDVSTSVTVSYDKESATKAVNDFVGAYNALVNSLKTLNAFDAASGTAGPLLGDSTLRDFLASLRRELGVQVSGLGGNFSTLADIGVTSQVDGTLAVNATRLDGFITGSFDQVGGLFANQASQTAPVDGLARRLDALINTYTGAGGLIEARTEGLQKSIDSIGDQRAALNNSLAALEARLRAQFTAMDTLVAQLNSTSNFLTQQIGTLNGSAIANRR